MSINKQLQKENKDSLLAILNQSDDTFLIKSLRITACLIRDFLKNYQLQHTLSVFLVEIGLKELDYYSDSELNSLIFNKNINSNLNHPKIIYLLLDILAKSGISTINQAIQTENLSKIHEKEISLEEKLSLLDKPKIKELSNDEINNKIIQIQRKYDEQYKIDLDSEIQRLKSIELVKIRTEEFEKYQVKLNEIRQEYDKEYKIKIDNLNKTEHDIQERLNLREKELEKREYLNRQELVNELQRIKSVEDSMNLKFKNKEDEIKILEKRLNSELSTCEYEKASSAKRVVEEIEQYKLEYERRRENEMKEINKKRMENEEREFKCNIFFNRYKQLEDDIIKYENTHKEHMKLIEDQKNKNFDLNKTVDRLNTQINNLLLSEQRQRDSLTNKDSELKHLNKEIYSLKESLEIHKKILDERKNEYSSLIDNLRSQLKENDIRNEKIKLEYESEYERLKKYYTGMIDKEYSLMKEKQDENSKVVELLRENLSKYKSLYNKLSNKLIENEIGCSHGNIIFSQTIITIKNR